MKSSNPPPNPSARVLNADALALITEGLAANAQSEPFSPERQARLGQQLMARIAQDSTTAQLTVPMAGPNSDWQRFLPGIERKVLHEKNGVMSYLLRLAAGAVLPAHHHPIDEECVVLQGDLRVGQTLVLHAGDFHLAHEGLPHDSISTDTGALIFLRGASPLAEHLV
jgi:quercetin dioxygenase-like cupin family protein